MNISCLRTFYNTVKFNSISKAAQHLHFTQPALSMQLQSLEKEVGAKLLKRSNAGVELTEAGKIVYDYARTMIGLADNLEVELKNIQNRQTELKICSCKSLGERMLLSGVYTFKKICPDADITLEIHNSQSVLKKLLNHEAGIGIVTGADVPKHIVCVPIMSDRLTLIGPKEMKENTVTLEELKRLPLILQERGAGVLALLEKALRKNGLGLNDLNVLLSLNSVEAIKTSIASGRGYAFLPEAAEYKMQTDAFKKINVKDFSIPFDYCIIYRDGHPLTEYEKKFIGFLSSDENSLSASM